jgi:arylamine N-acetyltransferase
MARYKHIDTSPRFLAVELHCQSVPHSFRFSALENSQRAAYNLAQHQHDWQKLMLIAGKNSALIDTRRLQTFRYLHACSGCFRLEHFAGWGLAPTRKRRLCTAHALRRHRGFSEADWFYPDSLDNQLRAG